VSNQITSHQVIGSYTFLFHGVCPLVNFPLPQRPLERPLEPLSLELSSLELESPANSRFLCLNQPLVLHALGIRALKGLGATLVLETLAAFACLVLLWVDLLWFRLSRGGATWGGGVGDFTIEVSLHSASETTIG